MIYSNLTIVEVHRIDVRSADCATMALQSQLKLKKMCNDFKSWQQLCVNIPLILFLVLGNMTIRGLNDHRYPKLHVHIVYVCYLTNLGSELSFKDIARQTGRWPHLRWCLTLALCSSRFRLAIQIPFASLPDEWTQLYSFVRVCSQNSGGMLKWLREGL